MKKLLLLALLVVGCESFGVFEHKHETVGICIVREGYFDEDACFEEGYKTYDGFTGEIFYEGDVIWVESFTINQTSCMDQFSNSDWLIDMTCQEFCKQKFQAGNDYCIINGAGYNP